MPEDIQVERVFKKINLRNLKIQSRRRGKAYSLVCPLASVSYNLYGYMHETV